MQKKSVNTIVFDSMDGRGVEPTTSGLQAARGGVYIDSTLFDFNVDLVDNKWEI